MRSVRSVSMWSVGLVTAILLVVLGLNEPAFAIAGASAIIFIALLATAAAPLRRSILVAVAVASVLLASSWFVGGSIVVSLALRGLTVLVMVLLGLSSGRETKPSGRQSRGWQWVVIIPLGVFLSFATLPHGLIGEFIAYSFGLVGLGLTLFGVAAIAPDQMRRGLSLAFIAILLLSLVLGIASPQDAIEGARLRGVFENANTLGFVAFLAIALSLYTGSSASGRLAICFAGLVCLIWSGSRASALAVLVVVVAWVISRNVLLGILVLIAGLIVVGPVTDVLSGTSPEFERLFRDTDSRAGSIATALHDWQSSPIWGVGLNQESSTIASSPLRALAQAGAVGFVSILMLCIGLLIVSIRANRYATWFAIAGIVHSLFEGWLLSPLAPLLLTFSMTWWLLLEGSVVSRVGLRRDRSGMDPPVPQALPRSSKSGDSGV